MRATCGLLPRDALLCLCGGIRVSLGGGYSEPIELGKNRIGSQQAYDSRVAPTGFEPVTSHSSGERSTN